MLHPRGVLLLLALLASAVVAGPRDDLVRLGRGLELVEVGRLELDFRTFEPRGLSLLDGRWYLASHEPAEGGKGRGRAHLLVADREGKRIRDLELGRGAARQPGGIASDGDLLWVPVSEGRPGGRTLVYTVDPRRLEARLRFQVRGCLTALAVDRDRRVLYALDHEARHLLTMTLGGRIVKRADDPNQLFEYRGLALLPGGELLATGAATRVLRVDGRGEEVTSGGLALFTPTGRVSLLHPMTTVSERQRLLVAGPATLASSAESWRLHFAPDPEQTTIYSFATAPRDSIPLDRSSTSPGRR